MADDATTAPPAANQGGRRLLFVLPIAIFLVLVIAFGFGRTGDPRGIPSALIDHVGIIGPELPAVAPERR